MGREDDVRKCRAAAIEITEALASTLRDLSPRLQTKFGIDGQLLNLAISQAAARTAAATAMAAAGGSVEESQQLGVQLDAAIHKAIGSKP